MMIPIPFLGWIEIDQEDKETMLREQLHAQQAEINALRKALMYVNKESKPLSDEEITAIHNQIYGWDGMKDVLDFARAIEKEHGIK